MTAYRQRDMGFTFLRPYALKMRNHLGFWWKISMHLSVALCRYADASGAGKDVYDFVSCCNHCSNIAICFGITCSTIVALKGLVFLVHVYAKILEIVAVGKKSWQV